MLPLVQSLGWGPSPPLAPPPCWGCGGVQSPGAGVWGACCWLSALPSALHEDAGADLLQRDPALLPPSPEGHCPAPTVAWGGPPGHPSTMGGNNPSPCQAPAELQSPAVLWLSGESSLARRKCPCER